MQMQVHPDQLTTVGKPNTTIERWPDQIQITSPSPNPHLNPKPYSNMALSPILQLSFNQSANSTMQMTLHLVPAGNE